MNNSPNNDKQDISRISMQKKSSDYWKKDTDSVSSTTYPQLEKPTFSGFIKKIGSGLFLTFIPAIVFSLISGEVLFRVWGLAILLVSGIFFLIGGCSDLSQTSARKSFKRYMDRVELTKARDEKFKFELGFFQFGNSMEDIAAAISLLAIAVLISNLGG
ncbi:MAG: hypothetical protein ACFFB5_06620 [Promethearchaeota archaeon]